MSNKKTQRILFIIPILIILLIIFTFRIQIIGNIECFASWALPVEENRNGETTKLILSIVGGIFILFGLYISYIRAKATQKSVEKQGEALINQNRQIELTRKSQTNERFKNAIEHLGSDKEPIILGGIVELHQITIDDPEKYREVVFNIFCSYIRQEANIKKDAEDINKTIIQTIVNYNFKTNFYKNLKADLSFCNLHSINIDDTILENCNLSFCILPWKVKNVKFINSSLSNSQVTVGRFEDIDFNNCDLFQSFFRSTKFENVQIKNNKDSIHFNCIDCEFINSKLEVDLYGSNFYSCEFNSIFFQGNSLMNINFCGSSFNNIDFSKYEIHNCDFSACGFDNVNMLTNEPIIETKFKSVRNEYKYFSQFLEKNLKKSVSKKSNFSGLTFIESNLFKCDLGVLTNEEKEKILLNYNNIISKYNDKVKNKKLK